MSRWRLKIEYDGGPFMGWQRQEHGPSVQQALEEALQRMTGEAGQVMDDSLTIACGSGCIRPLKVQRAGRAVMSPGDLLRGFAIPKGTILK